MNASIRIRNVSFLNTKNQKNNINIGYNIVGCKLTCFYTAALDRTKEVSMQIANYRENKHIGNKEPILREVIDYKNIMDKLLEVYKKVKSL